MTIQVMTLRLALALVACGASLESFGETVYPEAVDVAFEAEDKASELQGVFKCELRIGLVKIPNGVSLRVKLLKQGDLPLTIATIDAIQATFSNGIPTNARKVAISDPSLASDIFTTTSDMRKLDMGDGGMAINFKADQFTTLLKVVVRGDYIVSYIPKGATERASWIVREGATPKVVGQFMDCLKKRL